MIVVQAEQRLRVGGGGFADGEGHGFVLVFVVNKAKGSGKISAPLKFA